MKTRAWPLALATLTAVVAVAGWGTPAEATKSGAPPAGTVCTFTITPGLTAVPLAAPAKFSVTGELGGDPACGGSLTYIGQIDASGTCALTTFEGDAKGIPGVTRFAGVGAGPLGPARLYDKAGNVIASENANIVTADNSALDCASPEGFDGGTFSSTIVFLDQQP
jgi:hypothetical protein